MTIILGDPIIAYTGSIVSVMQQSVTKGGKTKTFEYAERAPGVRMIILNNEGKICITRERRHELHNGQGGYDFRLPGGKVVDTLQEYLDLKKLGDEALFVAAQKAVCIEAGEEVGIIPQKIDFIRISPCGATMRRDLYYFVISDFAIRAGGQDLGWSENIVVGRYTVDEVKSFCFSGKMSEDRSAAVLLQYFS